MTPSAPSALQDACSGPTGAAAGAGIPERVRKRPRPDEWSTSELMTLFEAAALFWPTGILTVTTLRTAVRDGDLAVARIAGKLFTSRSAVEKMTACALRPSRSALPTADPSEVRPVEPSEDDLLQRINARRQRAKS